MEVKIKKLHSSSHIPAYRYSTHSRIDLFAYLEGPVLLHPGTRKSISAGIAIDLPAGTEAQFRPNRSMAVNFGITILDTPYILGEGYHDNIEVLLINLGERGFSVKPGMVIAQMAIKLAHQPDCHLTEESEESVNLLQSIESPRAAAMAQIP
ncbi:MAG: dUTP diphosphatase [Cyanothece sp. SIO1E1]|nr:dUTP diphosphatase [Cyanothece sp. SIO1E1]